MRLYESWIRGSEVPDEFRIGLRRDGRVVGLKLCLMKTPHDERFFSSVNLMEPSHTIINKSGGQTDGQTGWQAGRESVNQSVI